MSLQDVKHHLLPLPPRTMTKTAISVAEMGLLNACHAGTGASSLIESESVTLALADRKTEPEKPAHAWFTRSASVLEMSGHTASMMVLLLRSWERMRGEETRVFCACVHLRP